MTKSIVVTNADKGKYKVLVCFVQRGIYFSSPALANQVAKKLAEEEHIDNVHLFQA